MLDPELAAKLDEIGAKTDRAYESAEKVRRYLFWTAVVTIILIVVPLLGLVFAIPRFLDTYTTTLNNLGA